jgi:hypothetical protein
MFVTGRESIFAVGGSFQHEKDMPLLLLLLLL